jgi:pyrophosphatase PpaX
MNMSEMRRLNANLEPALTTILFDLDDTLINSFRAREDTMRSVLKAGGITPNNNWNLANFRGLEIRDILRQSGIKEDELDEKYLSYRRIYWTGNHALVEMYGGVQLMLEKLHEYGIKMGIVTQKGRDFIFEGCRAGAIVELEKANILHLFEVIIGFEDVRQTKPDPEGINLALVKLQSRPEKTLFVGDSLSDMLAAKNAGCRSCHAQWGIANLEDLGADYILKAPQHLLDIIIPK